MRLCKLWIAIRAKTKKNGGTQTANLGFTFAMPGAAPRHAPITGSKCFRSSPARVTPGSDGGSQHHGCAKAMKRMRLRRARSSRGLLGSADHVAPAALASTVLLARKASGPTEALCSQLNIDLSGRHNNSHPRHRESGFPWQRPVVSNSSITSCLRRG